MGKLPTQDDFHNFCLGDETEKIHQRLEELVYIAFNLIFNNHRGIAILELQTKDCLL